MFYTSVVKFKLRPGFDKSIYSKKLVILSITLLSTNIEFENENFSDLAVLSRDKGFIIFIFSLLDFSWGREISLEAFVSLDSFGILSKSIIELFKVSGSLLISNFNGIIELLDGFKI